MKPPFLTIRETKHFSKLFNKLFGDDTRALLHRQLAENPECGVLLARGHGLRKLRLARPGRGKSGGARVIYYYWHHDAPLYLLTLFAKNEKDNLSPHELKDFATLARTLRKQQQET